jgi:hypothetical protein
MNIPNVQFLNEIVDLATKKMLPPLEYIITKTIWNARMNMYVTHALYLLPEQKHLQLHVNIIVNRPLI